MIYTQGLYERGTANHQAYGEWRFKAASMPVYDDVSPRVLSSLREILRHVSVGVNTENISVY